MRIIDHSPFLSEKGEITLLGKLQGPLKFGPSWVKDMRAQKKVMDQFSQSLDKRFVLLRNVDLLGSGVPVPLLLVGPLGVMVIYVSSLRGIYRAKNEQWMSMVGGKFRSSKPNLIHRVKLMAVAVETYLTKKGIKPPAMENVLLLTDPGMHVDMVSPAVRIVPGDALERFLATLVNSPAVLDPATVSKIAETIADIQESPEEIEEAFGSSDEEAEAALRDEAGKAPGRRSPRPGRAASAAGFRLTLIHWIILGAFIVFNILLLSCVLLYIVFFLYS
jgi:hypothetical protein